MAPQMAGCAGDACSGPSSSGRPQGWHVPTRPFGACGAQYQLALQRRHGTMDGHHCPTCSASPPVPAHLAACACCTAGSAIATCGMNIFNGCQKTLLVILLAKYSKNAALLQRRMRRRVAQRARRRWGMCASQNADCRHQLRPVFRTRHAATSNATPLLMTRPVWARLGLGAPCKGGLLLAAALALLTAIASATALPPKPSGRPDVAVLTGDSAVDAAHAGAVAPQDAQFCSRGCPVCCAPSLLQPPSHLFRHVCGAGCRRCCGARVHLGCR